MTAPPHYKKIGLATFLILLSLYVAFQSRNLILGPRLKITSPIQGETLAGPVIKIAGTAKNISFLTLNDRQIYVDDQGQFSETLLPQSGLVILKLVGTDRFGRTREISESIFVTAPVKIQSVGLQTFNNQNQIP